MSVVDMECKSPNTTNVLQDGGSTEQQNEQQNEQPGMEESQEKLDANSSNGTNDRKIRGVRWVLVCIGIFSANILYGLDNTIAADLQGPIGETFSDYHRIGWLGIGFCLGATAFILPLGKAYTVFDNKWMFVGCLAMFAAGSALCGGAPNMNAIIIGRVWAGAGGAGMYLGNLNLLTALTTPKEQPLYIAIIGLIYGVGSILGPIVGGCFADSSATWRWGFYINLLIFGVMVPIYVFLVPSLPQQINLTLAQKIRNFDWLGIILSIGVNVSFVLIFAFGGIIWPWNDGRTIALFVVFGLVTIAFAVTQYFCILTTKEDRLFPGQFLRRRTLVVLYVLMSCGGAALFVAVYYIPLFFQFVHGDSGTQSAVRLLPFICFYVTSILLCGYFMPKTGYYMLWYLASGILITIGAALMYTVRSYTNPAKIYGYSIVLGLGMATTQAGYAVATKMVTPDQIVTCIQFMNISQGQSQLIGLTVASTIFQNLTFRGIKNVLDKVTASTGVTYSNADIESAIAGAKSSIFSEVTADVKSKLIDVIVRSINDAYILALSAGALYIVASCLLIREN
ncbi:Efflux pump patC [Dipodascopsis uninucleata]